jgi:phosphoribosylformylglycinamidine synthase subunit PurL
VDGVHDISDGGLGVALAEMAVRSQVGFRIVGIADHCELFGEGPSRVIMSVPAATLDELEARAVAAGVGCFRLGVGGGDRLVVDGLVDLPLGDAEAVWRGALPMALRSGVALGSGAVGEAGGAETVADPG